MIIKLKKEPKKSITLSRTNITLVIFCLWIHDINYTKVIHNGMIKDGYSNSGNIILKVHNIIKQIFDVFFIEKDNKYIKVS